VPGGIGDRVTRRPALAPVPRQFVAVTTTLFSPGLRRPLKLTGPNAPPSASISLG
jgi:hypothetical protein